MNVKQKIEEMMMFYDYFLDYLDNEEKSDENLNNLNRILNRHNFTSNRHEIDQFLVLIQKVVHSHCHSTSFYDKIFRVLSILLVDIGRIFSNIRIFEMFKFEKRILLFLIEHQILKIDDEIKKAFDDCKYERMHYEQYFKIDNVDDDFIQKRKLGENDQYICELIRNDSIEKFVQYVTINLISITQYKIKPSIFETNSYLADKELSLIEYASFFGSIRIFIYLMRHGAELTPKLWNFAIHSRNVKLIHLLEDENVERPNSCLKESIKCHHNELARYFEDIDEETDLLALKYHNYHYFITDLDQDDEKIFNYFIKATQYNHYFIAEHCLKKHKIDVNRTITVPFKLDKKRPPFERNRREEFYERDDFISIDHFFYFFHKVDMKYYCQFNFECASALHFAIRNNFIHIVKMLLQDPNIDVNQKYIRFYNTLDSRFVMTPIHLAIEKYDLEITSLLVNNPKIDINKKSLFCISLEKRIEKRPAIFYAVEIGNNQIIDLLISHPKINVNAKCTFEIWGIYTKVDYEEKTPLIQAIENLDIIACTSLLSNKSVDINLEKIKFHKEGEILFKKRETALHTIIMSKEQRFYANLLIHNKNVDFNALYIKERINKCNERKKQIQTPLYLAVSYKNRYMVDLIIMNTSNIDEGLLNIGGGTDLMKDCESLNQYNPNKIMNVFSCKRRNPYYDFWGARHFYSHSIHEIKRILGHADDYNEKEIEEEDISDDFCFVYKIYKKISSGDVIHDMYQRARIGLIDLPPSNSSDFDDDEFILEEEEEFIIEEDEYFIED